MSLNYLHRSCCMYIIFVWDSLCTFWSRCLLANQQKAKLVQWKLQSIWSTMGNNYTALELLTLSWCNKHTCNYIKLHARTKIVPLFLSFLGLYEDLKHPFGRSWRLTCLSLSNKATFDSLVLYVLGFSSDLRIHDVVPLFIVPSCWRWLYYT